MKTASFTVLTTLSLLVGFSSCTYHKRIGELDEEGKELQSNLDKEIEKGKQLQGQ